MGSLPPFARVIKEQRDRLQMSRSQLAEAAELSYPYISQLETGLRKPSRNAARAIAGALGISVEDLERTIPGDAKDVQELRQAELFSDQLLSRGTPHMAPAAASMVASELPKADIASARDELISDMLDLLEEFDSAERLDVLAEVQKRAMRRMLEQQSREEL